MKQSRLIKSLFIFVTYFFVIILFGLPIFSVFSTALSEGVEAYLTNLLNDETLEAIKLSFIIVLIVLPINLVFGISASWAIAKFNFRGKELLISLIDLPLTISPIITGFMFLSIFGMGSYLGELTNSLNVQIIFALPAIVITTLFVTLPYIARELIPLMIEYGKDEEEAALSLGASGLKTFLYITLPNIKWGLLYGLLLSLSRSFGEFGAVSVVSGHIRGETTTIPMHAEILYNEYNYVAAFAMATILAFLAICALMIKNSFYRKSI